MDKKTKRHILLWLIGGLVLTFASEFFLRRSLIEVGSFFVKRPGVVLANYLLILMLTLIFFLAKRKYMVYFFSFLAILGVSAATYFLMELRGMPFAFSDLLSLREAMAIANNYISKSVLIIAVLCVIILIGIAVFLYKLDSDTKRFRFINFALILVVSVCFFSTTKVLNALDIMELKKSDIAESYKYNGLVYSTVESGAEYLRAKPSDYSKENIDKIKQRIDKKASEDDRELTSSKPNVIFVQLEAFMDPTEIKEVKFSEDPIPNFRKLTKLYTSGMANVPTTGGGTARTEFESMTGHNIDYMTPCEIPYMTILKDKCYNSVATTLGSQGYETHAIHNFLGNFYNRDEAYGNLGFGDFTTKEYMSNYELNEKGWVKDLILADYIEKALDSTEGSDLVYTISVQGHSSYPTDTENYDFPIKVTSTLDKEMENEIYYYVNQIKGSDDFVGKLIDIIDKRDEDTIILFYSDHTPNLKVFRQDDFYIDKYKAPFAFYANYDIEKYDIDEIESYEFSSLMFEEAGLEYGPMEKFNTYMKDEKDFSNMQELIEYDVLFGESYYIDENQKPKKNTLKMGLDEAK